MTDIERIDEALDQYVDMMRERGGFDPDGFRARTIAGIVGVPRTAMSLMLQSYRWAQRTGNTRYVIACNGYGSDARWRIMAKPGSDPNVMRIARAEQARWVVRDMARRLATDIAHEVRPGLRGHGLDAEIERLIPFMEDQVQALVRHVDRVLNNNA